MDSYQATMDRISALQRQALALRDAEKKRVIPEIRKLIEMYDFQPAELFSNTKPRVGRPVSTSPSVSARSASVSASAKGKLVRQSKPAKYRDPATGKTWNGHGKTPLWLVGVVDRTAYLIDAPAESNIAKPQKAAQRARPGAGRKAGAAKGTEKQKRAAKRETAPKAAEPDISGTTS